MVLGRWQTSFMATLAPAESLPRGFDVRWMVSGGREVRRALEAGDAACVKSDLFGLRAEAWAAPQPAGPSPESPKEPPPFPCAQRTVDLLYQCCGFRSVHFWQHYTK